MSKTKKANPDRVRITVLLDNESLSLIREFAYTETGTTNVSQAIMTMVKNNYGNKSKQNN